MNVQLRQLRYFTAIVEAGSISRAAQTLHVAQPALSQQMADLELSLGMPLLQRGTRGTQPTTAGELLYREAICILGRVGRLPVLLRSSGPQIEGPVTIGMSCTLTSLLKPLIQACRAALPKVILRCSIADGLSLRNRLEAHSLQLACALEDDLASNFGRHPFLRQACYLVSRTPIPGNPKIVSLRDLASLPLVLPSAPNVLRNKLDRILAEAGVAPYVIAEGDDMATMLEAVQAGVGCAVLPTADFSDIAGSSGLVAIPIDANIELTASVLWLTNESLTPAAEAVRNQLIKCIDVYYGCLLPPGAERVAIGSPQPAQDQNFTRPQASALEDASLHASLYKVVKAAA
jgi:LysR family transcriptional regulator, nitrogen assimilation regulatory protein